MLRPIPLANHRPPAASGWINEIFECYFTGNLIGVFLDVAINSVNVVDSNFENNHAVVRSRDASFGLA